MSECRQQHPRAPTPHGHAARGFTLIELLVAAAIILLLAAVLIPGLSSARESARMAQCGSNLHQLAIANHGYAAENRDYFVPAAPDEADGFGGRRRWHGMRRSRGVSENPDENLFDPRFSPLARYIEGTPALPVSALETITPLPDRARLKACPSFRADRDFRREGGVNAFEAGAGGYGYNNTYIGGRRDRYGDGWKAVLLGAQTSEVRHPPATVMFTETAFLQRDAVARTFVLVEQSFCYPPFLFDGPGQPSRFMAAPSIHFRHQKKGLCAWADGHVDGQRMSFSGPYAVFGISESVVRANDLGWFGPRANDWFDLR